MQEIEKGSVWFSEEVLLRLYLTELQIVIPRLMKWGSAMTSRVRVYSSMVNGRYFHAGESFLVFIPLISLASRAFINAEIATIEWLWETFCPANVPLVDFIISEGLQYNYPKIISIILSNSSFEISESLMIYYAMKWDHVTYDMIHALFSRLKNADEHCGTLAARACYLGKVRLIDLFMPHTSPADVVSRLDDGLSHIEVLQHLVIKHKVTPIMLKIYDIAARSLKAHGTKAIKVIKALQSFGCDIGAARKAYPQDLIDVPDTRLTSMAAMRWLRRRGWTTEPRGPDDESDTGSDPGYWSD